MIFENLERYFLAAAATLIIFVVLHSVEFIEFKGKRVKPPGD